MRYRESADREFVATASRRGRARARTTVTITYLRAAAHHRFGRRRSDFRPVRRRTPRPNLGPWPRCTTRPRSTSSRSSQSRRRASCRCGPGSSSASACRRRPCPRRSAGSPTTASSSSTATGACTSPTRAASLATTVVRRHRLAERLLVDVIGLEWEKVHREADRWEHAISTDVEEKLVLLLGDPATCPHGNPIPGSKNAGARYTDRGARRKRRPARSPSRRVSERLETDDDGLRLIAAAHLLPGSDATVIDTRRRRRDREDRDRRARRPAHGRRPPAHLVGS